MAFRSNSISGILGAFGITAGVVMAGDSGRIAAGEDHILLVRADGTLWGAGADQSGQLGIDGSFASIPVAIGDEAWIRVAAGDRYSLAIRSDGTLWSFGRNGSAQLGLPLCDSVSEPSPMDSAHWLDVAAGGTVSLGIRADSSLHLWGDWKSLLTTAGLKSGRKGRPRQAAPGAWRSVAMGADHALALRADGTLWAMGSNGMGQTGCPGTVPSRTLCSVGDAEWKTVSAGERFSVGIRKDGTLWSWGDNSVGELGRGAVSEWEPMGQVGTERWQSVSAGGRHVIAVRQDGTLWAWGAGGDGALGTGSLENQAGPVLVGYDKWTAAAAGKTYSAAIRADGEGLVWGNLGFMQAPGNGKNPVALRPTYLDRKLSVNPIGPALFGGRDPVLGFTAHHWDSVSITIGNPAVLQLNNGAIHVVGSGRGTVVIRAFPPAGSGQDTLTQIRAVTVAKARQSVAFPEPEPFPAGSALETGASSSIGLPVALVSLDPKVVRVVDQRLEAVAPGVTEVVAVQPGDANTAAAAPVIRKITVLPKVAEEVSVR
jgi:alpha-tubulin suppressor-like RCC1 family protein